MIANYTTKFKDGEETFFKEAILAGVKRHTIRSGKRWRSGMMINHYTGIRTKKALEFRREECPLVEEIVIQLENPAIDNAGVSIKIGGKQLHPTAVLEVMKNDGLSKKRFQEWFFSAGTDIGDGVTREFKGQIIHFQAGLKYGF